MKARVSSQSLLIIHFITNWRFEEFNSWKVGLNWVFDPRFKDWDVASFSERFLSNFVYRTLADYLAQRPILGRFKLLPLRKFYPRSLNYRPKRTCFRTRSYPLGVKIFIESRHANLAISEQRRFANSFIRSESIWLSPFFAYSFKEQQFNICYVEFCFEEKQTLENKAVPLCFFFLHLK